MIKRWTGIHINRWTFGKMGRQMDGGQMDEETKRTTDKQKKDRLTARETDKVTDW